MFFCIISPLMPQSAPDVKRLLLIGWDAADWKMIDPLLATGAMPNLKRLIDRGLRADLSSLDPKLSPILWTSIATGKTADKHGILNFIEPDPAGGGVRIASSLSRKTKAIWNILSQSDRRSIVVNWYATHPTEPIRGACVSNLFQEGPPNSAKDEWGIAAGAVSPGGLAASVRAARVHPSATALHDLRVLLPRRDALDHDDRRIALMKKLIAQCRSVHNVALSLLTSEQPWQCAMIFYDMIDVAGHHFMQYHPPRMEHVSKRDFAALGGVMNGVYRLHDCMLGALLKAAGDNTTVIVLSDHGFHSDHLRPRTQPAVHDEHAAMDATWHRQTGMLAMAGPGVRAGAQVRSAGLLDVTPTALTLLGLPVGEDMDGRVLMEALDGVAIFERVPSWDSIEGESGQHPADMRTDPFESREALKQLADLGYIQPVDEDVEKTLRDIDRETRSNLGVVYMSTRRLHRALPLFQHLHTDFPDEVRFALNLAHCQQATGSMDQAERTLSTFLQLHPAVTEARSLRATLLAAQRRFAEAAALQEDIAGANPNDTSLWIALAQTHRLAEQWEAADRALKRALSLDPRNAEVHHGLALLKLAQHQFEPAVEHALDAVELQHSMADAHYTLGVALAWMREPEHAAQSFRMALSMQSGMLQAHRFLDVLLRAAHDSESADEHAAEARRLEATFSADQRARLFNADDPLGPSAWAGAREHQGPDV